MFKFKKFSGLYIGAAVSLFIMASGFVSAPVQIKAAETKEDAEIAAIAAQALTEMAESETFVMKNISDPGTVIPTKVTTLLYYDKGKYYQEQTIEGTADQVIESFFDGETGWKKWLDEEWAEDPSVIPVPTQIHGMLSNAEKFIQNTAEYENFTYENGVITCQMTREALDRVLETAIQGLEQVMENYPEESRPMLQPELDRYKATVYEKLIVRIIMDEKTGVLKSFESTLTFTEPEGEGIRTAENISSMESLPELNAEAKVNEMLEEVAVS